MNAMARRLRRVFCVTTLACTAWAQASVVMTGTRVIYPADRDELTLQFHNPDAHPNAVQVWLDAGDHRLMPDEVETPFLVLPQVFRVGSNASQMVRLLLGDASALPQDRESLFYLNFSQMPVQKKTASDNQLLMMFTSRVKVFYRPGNIEPTLPADLAWRLRLRWQGSTLHVHNPTPYHVVLRQAESLANGKRMELSQGEMIAPFDDAVWHAQKPDAPGEGVRLRLVLLNDYGADVVVERPVL